MGRDAGRLRRKEAGQRISHRGRPAGVLPPAPRAFQMSEGAGLLRTAEDHDGQDPKIPLARTGKGARLNAFIGRRKRRNAGASAPARATVRVRLLIGAFLFLTRRLASGPNRNAPSLRL